MNETLRAKQLGVARGMGIGLGLTLATLILWFWRAPPAMLNDRLATLGTAVAVLGAWIAAGVATIARHRFFSAAAIDAESAGGDHDPAVLRNRAILQNTLEQAAVALCAYIALALLQDRSRMLIVALVSAFSMGRVLFWTGYADGAAARSLGFALTFYSERRGVDRRAAIDADRLGRPPRSSGRAASASITGTPSRIG